ncbi:MAG TPA: GntR family transcriptional regulator [Alphaproteobacteria bacterium]|nr:GntR family transcriptional regulator [Alphaproteobacteria bacterium]
MAIKVHKLADERATRRKASAAARGSFSGLARSPVARVDRVADQVYRNLRRAIIMGEVAPGSRLREVEVAAALNVSRTPVREAISRLIGDHLVRVLPTGGVEIVDATAELAEIYRIREALECLAARLAAQRITGEQLAKLDRLLEATRATSFDSFEERTGINHEFHMTVVEASGSPRLIEMIGGLREFFLNAKWLMRYDRKSAERAFQDHLEIVAALRARAPKRAERLVCEHLKTAYAKLLAEKENTKA